MDKLVDRRNYRVNFKKINNLFKHEYISVEDGIKELYRHSNKINTRTFLKIEKSMGTMRLKMKKIDYTKIFVNSFRKKRKDKNKILPLHEPLFDNLEKKYVIDCITSTYVSTRGKLVTQFEKKIKNITDSKYAIATINGTCAIHLGLKLLGAKYGDEVILQSLTFAGTTNAVLNAGCTPHFLESEYETLGIDPIKLDKYLKNNTKIKKGECYNKKKKKIASIIVVHVFGHPSKLNRYQKFQENIKFHYWKTQRMHR